MTMNFDSMDEELNHRITEWLEWDLNQETLADIKQMVANSDWDTLRKRLCVRLEFGTAGLRGPMQAGFSSMNDLVIVQTAQGFAKYILKCFPTKEEQSRGLIIGYDGRHNSKRFAELSVSVFINHGIPVHKYSRMVITPFIPFGISEMNCLAGVMVTASHNPKQDNGYKVYWSNGAQIIPPHDTNIQEIILKNLIPLRTSWDLLDKHDKMHDPYDEVLKSYLKKVINVIAPKFLERNADSNLRFVYTAMHGVGYPFIVKLFEAARLKPVIPVEEQRDPDPEFPTVKYPNPEEGKSCLLLSQALADKQNISIILANDPDADRLAIAEKIKKTNEWKIFTGNEIGSLLGWWSIQNHLEKNPNAQMNDCYILASTVSSKMLRAIAKAEGLNFEETLTGFKWMGNRAHELMKKNKTVLFAFEEAIGFMFSTMVLDKDGVSAAVMAATMSVHLKINGDKQLNDKLEELYNKYGFHCTLNSYVFCYDPKKIVEIFEKIRNFEDKKDNYPKEIGSFKIKNVRDLTTGTDSSEPDGIAKLPASSSTQMITFDFENGVVLTLRTSGTEPKIKYYSEMCGKPEEKNWNGLRDTLAEVVHLTVEQLLQPDFNNLTRRTE